VRWEKRLTIKPVEQSTDASTLVLKTQYNLAWNYFNAHEFGQTVFDYWAEWLQHHEAGTYTLEYPPPPVGQSPLGPNEWDLRKTNIFASRVIVSRKRTRNFLDLTNLWKKSVLETLEERVAAEAEEVVLTLPSAADVAAAFTHSEREVTDVNTTVQDPDTTTSIREDQYDSDEFVENVRMRHSFGRATDAWRSGAGSTWGSGSRRL
jgi:hypothetical protein